MLVRLFILLATLNIVAFATSIPQMEETEAIRAIQQLFERAKGQHDIQQSALKEHVETAVKSAKVHHDSHGNALNSKKFLSAKNGQYDGIRKGFLMYRVRPNADCSGLTTIVSANALNSACVSEIGYSYYSVCGHEDKNGYSTMETTVFYDSEDCTGPSYSSTTETMKQCAMDYSSFSSSGPESMSTQCAHADAPQLEKKGLMTVFYSSTDGSCSGDMTLYLNIRFDACWMQVSNEHSGVPGKDTQFYYVQFTGCGADEKVTLTYYSDSACTRPFRQASVKLQHAYGGQFNTCVFNGRGSQDSLTTCAPLPKSG